MRAQLRLEISLLVPARRPSAKPQIYGSRAKRAVPQPTSPPTHMVVLGVGEAAAETTAGTVKVIEGPGDFKTTGKVETLVLTKVSAFQYMVSTSPGGEITHTAGPMSMCARSRALNAGGHL